MTTALLFHFDDAAPFADAAGHSVTQVGSPATGDPTGEFGTGAMDCAGGGYLTIGSAADLGLAAGTAYTLDLRVWLPNTTVSGTTFYWLFGSDTARVGFFRMAGDPGWYLIARRTASDGTTAMASTPITTYGTAKNLRVGRATNGDIYLFIDGVLQGVTSGLSAAAVSQSGWFVGRPSGSDPVFPGLLEEARFTPGSNLTTANYTNPSSAFADPPTPSVVGLPIALTVGAMGSAALPLALTVGRLGSAHLGLEVEVIPNAILAGTASVCWPAAGVAGIWRPVVAVDGVDRAGQVVGEITIEAEEGAARVAEITLKPPAGTAIFLPDWTGADVAIDIADASTGTPRWLMPLFTGVIDLPSIDLVAGTITLRCTDDLQGRCDAMDNAALAAVVGGRFSPAVFDPASAGWRYAQDRVSTAAASLDISPAGALRLTPWQPKVTPDLSFDDVNHLLDGTVATTPADRAGLVNQVAVTFAYRYPRLKAEGHAVAFSYVGPTNFATFVTAGGWFLQRAAVEAAISAAGGALVAPVSYDPLPSTGVDLGGGGFWTPGPADAELCQGFTATVSFDYGQTIDEIHAITVKNDLSIAAVGLRAHSLSGALEGKFQETESWETKVAAIRAGKDPIPVADKATVVGGMITAKNPAMAAGTDRAAADEAMRTLVDIAKAQIQAAHRRNVVSAAVLLNPAVDVDKTIALDTATLQATGKCRRVVHRLNPASGQAVSEFELAICSVAGVGITHADTATSAPAADPATSVAIATPPLVVYNSGASEDHKITITFPAVPSAQRDNAAPQILSTFDAPLFEDEFSLTL